MTPESPTHGQPGALPLRPVEFEILLALALGERHGYAIIREVERRSEGGVRLETGTLYRALQRLVQGGMVTPVERRTTEPSEDERRRYYALTPHGRGVAAAEAARMARLVAAAQAAQLIPGAGLP
ncbi:MAG: helix-turn-helix transcriptional regulator [Gemmatimonadaceae bacterium]|nr:helix-turn-helix transcriptional regulator [Gemmatimonadaceae bacterium]